MSDNSEKLEAQLREKEELVSMLTERLEQAAEQLDRIQRTGSDRAGRSGGGVPLEMIEEQRSLTQNLQEVVTHWDESQPTKTLERIENHLIELRELVTNQHGGGGFTTTTPSQTQRAGESETSGLSGYEALKASMLSENPVETIDAIRRNVDDQYPEETTTTQEPNLGISVELPEPELVDPPEVIDIETGDLDVLRQAVDERDTYIGYLIGKLKASESRADMKVDWASLDNAPEDLRNRLQGLEQRLEELQRLAEVELALERARLGREANRQDQLELQIKTEMKKLGLSEENDADPMSGHAAREVGEFSPDDDESYEDDDSQGNRWLRMLGR